MIQHPHFYSFASFNDFPLIQGYFDRSIGSMAIEPEINPHTLTNVLHALEVSQSQLKLMRQCHGKTVSVVSKDTPFITEEVDGLVTKEKKVVLGLVSADCLPIILYDSNKQIIGACHAGYKGLLAGIIPQTIAVMEEQGAKNESLHIAVGPCICKSCYNVDKERIALFKKTYPALEDFYEKKDERYLLDLRKVALYVFQTQGIVEEHIEFSTFCTKENNDRFFSRRAEKEGVFLTVVGML